MLYDFSVLFFDYLLLVRVASIGTKFNPGEVIFFFFLFTRYWYKFLFIFFPVVFVYFFKHVLQPRQPGKETKNILKTSRFLWHFLGGLSNYDKKTEQLLLHFTNTCTFFVWTGFLGCHKQNVEVVCWAHKIVEVFILFLLIWVFFFVSSTMPISAKTKRGKKRRSKSVGFTKKGGKRVFEKTKEKISICLIFVTSCGSKILLIIFFVLPINFFGEYCWNKKL